MICYGNYCRLVESFRYFHYKISNDIILGSFRSRLSHLLLFLAAYPVGSPPNSQSDRALFLHFRWVGTRMRPVIPFTAPLGKPHLKSFCVRGAFSVAQRSNYIAEGPRVISPILVCPWLGACHVIGANPRAVSFRQAGWVCGDSEGCLFREMISNSRSNRLLVTGCQGRARFIGHTRYCCHSGLYSSALILLLVDSRHSTIYRRTQAR